MKIALSILALTFSVSAFATKPILIESDKAVMEVCQLANINGRMLPAAGCMNKITIGKKSYPFASEDKKVGDLLSAIVGANQFHKVKRSQPFQLEGRIIMSARMGYRGEVIIVDHVSGVILPKGMPH